MSGVNRSRENIIAIGESSSVKRDIFQTANLREECLVNIEKVFSIEIPPLELIEAMSALEKYVDANLHSNSQSTENVLSSVVARFCQDHSWSLAREESKDALNITHCSIDIDSASLVATLNKVEIIEAVPDLSVDTFDLLDDIAVNSFLNFWYHEMKSEIFLKFRTPFNCMASFCTILSYDNVVKSRAKGTTQMHSSKRKCFAYVATQNSVPDPFHVSISLKNVPVTSQFKIRVWEISHRVAKLVYLCYRVFSKRKILQHFTNIYIYIYIFLNIQGTYYVRVN